VDWTTGLDYWSQPGLTHFWLFVLARKLAQPPVFEYFYQGSFSCLNGSYVPGTPLGNLHLNSGWFSQEFLFFIS